MDQIQQRERAIAKLRKIKVLALEGVGGEKTGAQKMYEDLKNKYQITEAEIEEKLPEPKKRQQLSFTMAVLQQQLHEEHLCCDDCPEHYGNSVCSSCGTYGNIKDLEEQWEHLTAEMEGRQYAGKQK